MFTELTRRARSLVQGVAAQALPGVVAGGIARLADAVRAAGGQPLAVELPDGSRIDFGAPTHVTLRVRNDRALAALAEPTLAALAEAFVDGDIDIDGDMAEAIAVADAVSAASGADAVDRRPQESGRHTRDQDRADVQFHYDIGNDFYRLWLDQRMVYSCAYFRRGDEDLDAAQRAKLDHICRKLRLAPGERLLDIGCGWGGLVLHAAREYGVQAVGVTLAEQQLALARERVAAEKLEDRVEILALDYRELPQRYGAGAFDKVASIGMFEHVGLRNLPEYFGVAATMLRDRGLFLNHGITTSDVDSRPIGSGVGDFIDRHVFPNGELPHLHVAVHDASAQGLEVFDVESLRPHYALTLDRWSQRLEAQLAVAAQMIDARRLRIWRAYLAGCAHAFRQGWINIYQVLMSRQATPGLTGLPLTRDWLYRD